MGAFQRRAVPLISVVAVGAAIAAVPTLGAPSSKVNNLAICPRGMVSNPVGYGYGCGPDLAPGGAFVGAPSQELLTRCHGNYYICVWPYPVP
jgi:hypothetical protein